MDKREKAADDLEDDDKSQRAPEGNGKDRRGIQSIEVGGQLLLALARRGEALMLRDLAREAGMPAAKAHPYLVSFGKIGLIEQDRLTGRYGLGSLALQLGLASLHQLNPVRLAVPAAADLCTEVDQAVALAVWGNHGPTVVHIEESSHPLHVNLRVGTVMSLLDTATGRVFAAYLPPALVSPLMEAELNQSAHADPADRPERRRELEEALAEVRKRECARAVGQPIPGINALSAPVFDHSGKVALVITAMGTANNFDATWKGPIAERLLACCEGLSRRLGFSG